MLTLVTLFSYALILGLFHAFEGDHITAVSTITFESNKPSLAGLFWGVGHTLVLLIAGGIVLLLGVAVPESFANMFEGFAGMLLLLLGVSVILKIKKDRLHVHSHSHDGSKHIHMHSHEKSLLHRHEHKSFIFGIFHGLAGSGALLLLILPNSSSILEGFLFILVFGLGSIFGMTLVSFILGRIFEKFSRFVNLIQFSAGTLSILIGFGMVFQIIA